MKRLKNIYLSLNIFLQIAIIILFALFVTIDCFGIYVYGKGVNMQDLLTLIYMWCAILSQILVIIVFGILYRKTKNNNHFKKIKFVTLQRIFICLLVLEFIAPLIIW